MLKCDVCAGPLKVLSPTQACCLRCGVQYGPERLGELLPTPPAAPKPRSAPTKGAPAKDAPAAGVMWLLFGLVCLCQFLGALLLDSGGQLLALTAGCMGAALLLLALFKPWNIYGGKIL